ncbi:FecR domain-containing protein [Chitinophaga oryzae]|uniref:FecR domain-containing protein n=1 Tax=Chitinophaga oryzae TaxID=2725414 RepID=A0AAE6ZCN3_9BACT|nr:FecR domain-containing protein [Chitinophaga oryzae]QJB30154.1 FecR domain-containing protein [Chitinophaga oryzae]
MDNEIFRKLLQKHAGGQALSPGEEAALRQAYDHLLEEEIAAAAEGPSPAPEEQPGADIRERIDQHIAARRTKRFHFYYMKRAAAALVVGFILSAGIYWFLWDRKVSNDRLAQQEEVLPGGNKARLTLADGSVISLGDAQNGLIATESGVRIEKDANGNIRYHTGEKQESILPAVNTITTPNGGQYRVTLPDGSVAMLNAASSLSYPVRFSEKERRVKMTGEVYFEIEKMRLPGGKGNVPFFVETAGQEVQVLGTHFNVNAYRDETAIRTTLVEGSVKIKSKDGQSTLLKPGQQAVLAEQLHVQQADIQQQLAWVNGDFVFGGETLESILHQVERWYDIEAECPAHIGKLRFNGMVSRSQPLSAIVKMIQSTRKATVTIKKRRLIVTD